MKTSFDPNALASLPPPPARPQTSRGLHEQYRAQSQEIAITLTTKEGDRITLSNGFSMTQYSGSARTDSDLQTISQTMTAAGMSVSLQGDLNEQEIKDLTELMSDLQDIATDFFNGNLDLAVKGAASIGDMGSISELSATFSRTSVLAEYLQGPHPLPAFFETPNDLPLPEGTRSHEQKAEPLLSSALPDLWQQFLGALKTLNDTFPAEKPDAASSITSAAKAAEEMLARSLETMHDHPRLTPLIPSVAGFSTDQAARHINQGQQYSQLAKELKDAFNSAFNNWVL